MSFYIELDKPRKLEFTLNSMAYLEGTLGIKNMIELSQKMGDGSITTLIKLYESCLLKDNEGLGGLDIGEMLTDYVGEHGLEAVMSKITEAITESKVFGNESDKKKAKKIAKKNKAKKS